MNKAAEALLMTQLNSSRATINLETGLNIKPLKCSNKGVVMTEDGKKLYQYSRTVLNQTDLIKGTALREIVPILSIASYLLISISRLLCEVYNNHKDGSLKIQLLERRLQRIIETVEGGEAELGSLMYNDIQSKEIECMLHCEHIELNYLGTDTWRVNVGPYSPLHNGEEVEASELLSYPIARMSDDYFSNLAFYLPIGDISLTEFKRVEHVSDNATMINLLEYTDVFRLGPGISGEDFAVHGIKTIPIKNCEINIGAAWIHGKKEILSAAAREFVQMLELWISKAIH